MALVHIPLCEGNYPLLGASLTLLETKHYLFSVIGNVKNALEFHWEYLHTESC